MRIYVSPVQVGGGRLMEASATAFDSMSRAAAILTDSRASHSNSRHCLLDGKPLDGNLIRWIPVSGIKNSARFRPEEQIPHNSLFGLQFTN